MRKEENEERKFFSKRRYPEIDCENDNCISGGPFEPHDRRQKFCCPQCRINFYNDRRNIEENTIFLDAKHLKYIDRKLDRMYKKYVNKDGSCQVIKELFHYESINVMLLLEEFQNKASGQKVKGYFRYGIELSAADNNFYFIHKLKRS
jgi:hypothetical protein